MCQYHISSKQRPAINNTEVPATAIQLTFKIQLWSFATNSMPQVGSLCLQHPVGELKLILPGLDAR